jgi:hypothetical protein
MVQVLALLFRICHKGGCLATKEPSYIVLAWNACPTSSCPVATSAADATASAGSRQTTSCRCKTNSI